jgi:hypothetical protein
MVEREKLPCWREIFLRIGEEEPRRGRARCPIHDGDSRTSLSTDEDRGFHCFVCGASGDKISFIQQLYKCDFKDALRFYGLEPGKPPKLDPASLRRNVAMDRVRQWIRTTGRRLRDEYLNRQRITVYARKRLAANPVDQTAWELLRIAFDGEAKNEFLLDEIDLRRDDYERLRAWRKYRDEV